MLSNCGAGEDSWESLGLQGDPTRLVNPKGNQSWVFIRRTDAEAEVSILWPPDAKSWLNGKDPDAGKDWRQKEKRAAEDEMIRHNHRLNRHEFEQTEDRAVWCNEVCGVCKELDTTYDWTTANLYYTYHRVELPFWGEWGFTDRGTKSYLFAELLRLD